MDIPNIFSEVPDDFTEGDATFAELKAAGFHSGLDLGEDKPGQQPLDEMLVEGEQWVSREIAAQTLRHLLARALRDPAGKIVATWDEGRWWTPDESAELTRRIAAEFQKRAGDGS